ncbi:MAG: helix-turn-helix domain-containing protein [Ruminococcus sp.]|nr:helix-turn-helix domain-containing protein [Ruminococcus sp.]
MYCDRLRKLRENKNLNQSDLANILNIERTAYTQYESEYVIIPTKHLNTLCNYFNVSLDYIFEFTNLLNYDNSLSEIDKIKSGAHLKEFRKENNLTQEKLANNLNTVHSVITKCENGINIIALPFLYTICTKYNISADYLLGKVDYPKYLK